MVPRWDPKLSADVTSFRGSQKVGQDLAVGGLTRNIVENQPEGLVDGVVILRQLVWHMKQQMDANGLLIFGGCRMCFPMAKLTEMWKTDGLTREILCKIALFSTAMLVYPRAPRGILCHHRQATKQAQ